ncbi:MAG TPA: threonine ammonia-lyase [Candidatus Binatia bacterium]|nr:threonine ammonia-lyase [Candidatus Binatia bacterium]
MIALNDIDEARRRIADQIYQSPCAYSETISRKTGKRVFFKLENLQMTGSFKERGAPNRLLALTPEEKQRGVITASAGNHGMAVAFHTRRLGIRSTVVMPTNAPLIKVTQVRGYGAEARLFGADYDGAFAEAEKIARERNSVYVHPFNDALIVAGQGTIGLELHEQNPELEAVVVPVGGGGLIAGIALALKTLNPKIRVIGVQSEQVPSMKAALENGRPVQVAPATTIADGISVRAVGQIPFDIVRSYVDEIVTVSEGEIAEAVLLLLEVEKTVAEGAAAVGLAALAREKIAFAGKNVALVVSGGNIDVNLISRIIEKGLVQGGRLTQVSVVLPDRPGSLARLAACVAAQGANVLSAEHGRGFADVAIGETEIRFVIETTGREHIEQIYNALKKEGFRVVTSNGAK